MSRARPYRIGFEQFKPETCSNRADEQDCCLMRGRLQMVEVATTVAAAALAVVPARAPWIEAWYSTGLYPHLERLLTPASNVIPFAILDILLVTIAVAVLVSLGRAVRHAWQTRTFSG